MMNYKVMSDRTLACAARLSLRRFRNLAIESDLQNHEQIRKELERRGYTDRYGIFGWDEDRKENG